MNEKYDLICVFKPGTAEEKIDAAIARIEKKIISAGGTVTRIAKQGLRRMATRMRRFKVIKDGYFTLIAFESPGNIPQEITALVRVNEDIMRSILTRGIEKIEDSAEKAVETAVEINPEMLIGKPE